MCYSFMAILLQQGDGSVRKNLSAINLVERSRQFLTPELLSVLSSRAIITSLVLLLLLDFVFIIMHIAHLSALRYGLQSVFQDVRFSIEIDRGYSEQFEYAKTLICVLALLGCWTRTRQPIYAAVAFAFGFVLADNALGIHEKLGAAASVLFLPAARAFEAAPQALGEIVVYAFAGAVVFGAIALAWLRTETKHRYLGLAFVLLLGGLSAFGVGVDLVHAAVGHLHNELDKAFGLLEDGGELTILSAICALSLATYAKLAAERHGHPAPSEGRLAIRPPPYGIRASGASWRNAPTLRRFRRTAPTLSPKP